MLNSKETNLIFGLAIMLLFIGCVDPFEAETQVFENALVVDARLTNEEKKHEIILARSYRFGQETFVPENNASVQIIDEFGNTYAFEQEAAGHYRSISAFAAQPNMGYELSITTTDGKSYKSETVVTPLSIVIDEIKAEIDFSDSGEEGLQILLTNESTNTEAKYFRYEYEETFKIVAPSYSPFKFEVSSSNNLDDLDIESCDGIFYHPSEEDGIDEFFFIAVKPRDVDVSTCYSTRKSRNLILGGSDEIATNLSSRFKVRFVNRYDYSISHRYSILVKQFRLTRDANAYYTNLNDFTSSESIFSQIQPGFLDGNIKSAEGSNQKVLGYFEVASVSQERLFFNYVDFFTNESSPSYAIDCEPIGAPPLTLQSGHENQSEDPNDPNPVDRISVDSPLIDGILEGQFVYYARNTEYEEQVAAQYEAIGHTDGLVPYFVKATACGDCTVLGSLMKPDFWIE